MSLRTKRDLRHVLQLRCPVLVDFIDIVVVLSIDRNAVVFPTVDIAVSTDSIRFRNSFLYGLQGTCSGWERSPCLPILRGWVGWWERES